MKQAPNFFIIGAAKAGTTSLASYLGQHPNIFMPDCYREPAYFASDTGLSAMPEYLNLFKDVAGHHVAVGEKSTAYLYDEDVAKKLCGYGKKSKIIIVLREQLQMAYSLYRHNRREGLEPLGNFREALDIEPQRIKSQNFRNSVVGYHKNFYYRDRATYAPQIERYTRRFGPEQIRILRFTDFASNPIEVVSNLYRWLGVDPTFVPSLRIENRGGRMRLQWLHDKYMRAPWLQKTVRAVTTHKMRRKVYWLNRSGCGYTELPVEERVALGKMFDTDREQLETRYGIRFEEFNEGAGDKAA